MAINLKFDLLGNPEPPSIVLANRNGNKLGQLNVNVESIDVSDKFNAASEFSFTLNKYIDGEPTPLWDKVVDFKIVYCPEWDLWFEIKVELDETTETVKTVFCTQLGQAELSQIKVYNIHINEEGDPNWDTNNETYKSTILYDTQNTDASLLHRLLKDKAPHYSIAYVDESIQRIQKTFSFDDTSICDAFNEIEEEIGCLFVYNSNSINDVNSDKRGKPSRTISVYDLQQNCLNPKCKHRGEFTDVCPKCNSQDDKGNKYGIKYGYGEDTTIFVTSDELGSQGISLTTDIDSVKNCFKLEGGDDLMTATIRNCNPNGSDYIWYFSDALKEDMSKELVEKLESYDKEYQYYYNEYPSELSEDIVSQYNELVDKYDNYYNTKSTCLSCGTEGYFYEQCPSSSCNSKNLLTGKELQTIDTTITGYPALMTAYYNTIDLDLYLKSGLMPNVEIGEKSLCLDCNNEGIFAKVCPKCNSTNILSGAKYQLHLLTTSFPSTVAVNVDDVDDITLSTANSAVLSMAKVIVKSTYKVEVIDDSPEIENGEIDEDGDVVNKLWTGKFKITNYSDEDDYVTSEEIVKFINNDTKRFVEQKIEKALNKENTDDYSITGLFAKELNVDDNGNHKLDADGVCQGAETLNENGEPVCPFCAEIKKYALNPLVNFSKVCDTVLSILQEQGIKDGNEDDATKQELYKQLYKPYFEKQRAINNEIALRESEIAIIEGVWDKSDENNPKCTTWGLQQYIEKCQQDIQEELNFEKHLGEDLWLEFCAYRREDKYSNSNYVSDGLNNAELFDRALEFIEVAEEEIFKSAELQHSISATLNNLLSLPKFKPLLKSFKTGNWIRVQVDGKVYKLRLLEYGFGYGDSESISVEFSDVTKIKNGVTDVKEVLEQASSMASSYDSVQRQAEKGNVARSTIDQWLVDGLNAANMQIASNDSEEVLLTKSGLLGRSYDDITGTYSPEQLKITHNIMAYTTDNWETVSSALGKHKYTKWTGSEFTNDEDYGLSAKFAQAAYIIGSQIIGGEIVSSNYQPKQKGTHINLLNGDFDFAGGKITYDAKDNNVTLKGVTIQWDGEDAVNPPAIQDVTGLTDEIEKINTIDSALSPTTINGKSVVSPLIVGGYLDIKNDTYNTGVVIDPNRLVNNEYVFRAYNGNTTAIGLDVDGNAEFSGTIKSSKVESTDIVGSTIIGSTITGGTITAGNTLYIGSQKDEDGNIIANSYSAWIDIDGVLHTNEAHINGTITAIDGMIGGFNIEPTVIEEGVVKAGGRLWSGELQEGQDSVQIGDDKSIFLSATDMSGTITFTEYEEDEDGNPVIVESQSFPRDDWRLAIGSNFGVVRDGSVFANNALLNDCTITGGSLKMGTYEDGYSMWISADEGILNAYGANINGTITAIDGAIAGWKIDGDKIHKGAVGMSSGSDDVVSLVKNGEMSSIRFFAGDNIITVYADVSNVEITNNNISGVATMLNECPLDCYEIYAEASVMGMDGLDMHTYPIMDFEWSFDSSTYSVSFSGEIDDIALNDINASPDWSVNLACTVLQGYKFQVLADGSLYASAAEIEGNIRASGGRIGKILVTDNGLQINDKNANIDIGNLSMCCDDDKTALLKTSGALKIVGSDEAAIELMTNKYVDEQELIFNLYAYKDEEFVYLYVQTEGDVIPYYPVEVVVDWEEWIIDNPNTLAQSGSLCFEMSSSRSAIESIKYTQGEVISLRFNGSEDDANIIDLDITNTVSKMDASIDNIPLTKPDAQINIVGDIVPAETATLTNDGLIASGYNLGYKDWSDDSDSNINNRYWAWIFATKMRLASSAQIGGNLTVSGTINGEVVGDSDRNKKNTIAPFSDAYDMIFDALKPVSYRFNSDLTNLTHTGLIAQDVKEAVEDAGLTTQDFAGYCEWKNDNGNLECGLRYSEFISLCIDQIQKLKKRVAELENK